MAWGKLKSFNSRTREGATDVLDHLLAAHGVSIHAPVRVRLRMDINNVANMRFQSTHP